MSEPLASIHNAARLTYKALHTTLAPANDQEYRELLALYRADPAFARHVQDVTSGLELIILDASDRGLVVVPSSRESKFAVRMGDIRLSMGVDQKAALLLAHVAIAAVFFPTTDGLDDDNYVPPPASVANCRDTLHALARRLKESSDLPPDIPPELVPGWEAIAAMPVLVPASQRASANSLVGVVKLALSHMQQNGLVRLDREADDEVSVSYTPTHRLRVQLRGWRCGGSSTLPRQLPSARKAPDMQKISRIYLGNTGYMMAWYDGITFDLSDQETGEPSDTIINLENGGGKTSLLSLIFSCFETSQDRFLKHIQSRNNHFSQYFSQDGLPGFILVEWQMPPRMAGGEPYRLVVGQVVSIKTGNDVPESDRMFFSFEEREGLALKDVPAPKLGGAPATTMAEFSRWVHEEQKKHPGNVFITRKQADWQRHLREERLIDLEMLQMQVNFSAQEGGFDAGFLNFNNESEFLRKFYHLTLDPQRAASVREAVGTTCDKLRRKPQYQRKLIELTKFQGILRGFSDAAFGYRHAMADQVGVLVQGAQLAQALQLRAQSHREGQAWEQTYEAGQRKLAEDAAREAVLYAKQVATLTSLGHLRAVAETKTAKGNADAEHVRLGDAINHVRAARVLAEMATADKRIEELEALAGLAKEGLQPFRDQAEMQGALLRMALFLDEQSKRAEHKRLSDAGEARELVIKDHRKIIKDADNERAKLLAEQAKLIAHEERFLREHRKLVDSGLLERPDELTDEAVTRLGQLEAQLRSEKAVFESERLTHDTDARRFQADEVAANGAVGRIEADIKSQSAFIGEGSAERERLSQLPAILQAVEADMADPDSPALVPLLQRVVTASAHEVSLCDVRLAELNATKQAIDETGVSASNPDVARVVSKLKESGVRSARPFNEYIADALPDAGKARELVLSDPSRFLGVSVAEGELDKVQKVTWDDQKLGRPVVVSPVALEHPAVYDSRVVVPAATDAAYNRPAAAALVATLQESIALESKRRSDFYARQTGALAALEALEAYERRFGAGKLAAAQAALTQLKVDRDTALLRKEEAGRKARTSAEAARAAQQYAQEREVSARDVATHIRSLLQFKAEYETDRDARLERMAELEAILEDLEGRKVTAQEGISRLEELTRADYRIAVQLDTAANELGRERAGIEFYDRKLNAEEQLKANPADLATLRATFKDALSSFNAEEESRLGLLKERLQGARDTRKSKAEEFARDYPGVTKTDVKPYEGMDHTAMLPGLQAELASADTVRVTADSAHQVATRDSTEWHRRNKDVPPATPDMEALTAEELAARKDETQTLSETATQRQIDATAEAERAKGNAKRRGEAAATDDKLAELLKSSMQLEDKANPELLALELASLAGAPPKAFDELEAPVLEVDATSQVTRLLKEHNNKVGGRDKARDLAQTAFDKVKSAAADKELQEVEPELATQMLSNDFNAACSDAGRLLEGLDDRIATTQGNLDKMQADFDACVEELLAISRSAVSLLTAATGKRVPAGAPYVAGKAVLKMRANFSTVTLDLRRQAIQHYLDHLIDTNVIPAKGADLVAESVLRMYGGKPLGLQVLRMVVDETQQYVPLDKITNSGGEGVVMAMFLYVVITQLRAESQAKLHKQAGGPLILDNPFAKATSPTMWKAQRLLAQSMGVQLIFATAIQDYNALGEFASFVRLRRAGQNSKTGRWHLEAVRYKLSDEVAEAA